MPPPVPPSTAARSRWVRRGPVDDPVFPLPWVEPPKRARTTVPAADGPGAGFRSGRLGDRALRLGQPGGLAELVRLVGLLPGEVVVLPAEVAVGRGLLV